MSFPFGDRATDDLYRGVSSPQTRRLIPRNLVSMARRKIDYLLAASKLSDLRAPPGNRLEKLKGDLDGMHSIRINGQFRIIFQWTEDGPEQIQVVDYH